MPTFRAPRGTRDLLPAETPTWTRLERLAMDLAARYGYRRIDTPLIEVASVFERGIGEVTDVVEKELFRIAPRTEESESWALRPEPTAGIARAFVQHGMHTWPQPVRLAQIGAMFRYDRPQAGRYRQFSQFDVEAIGDAGPAIDAEIIELGAQGLSRGRARGRRGPPELDRRRGVPAGVHRGAHGVLPRAPRRAAAAWSVIGWSATCSGCWTRRTRRWQRSTPGRRTSPIGSATPVRPTSRASATTSRRWASRYRLAPGLVRGLDYYTRTAFEYYVEGREGQQQAIGGGGRYDGLVELLGGRPTPGIGFGIGLDRLVLALEEAGLPPAPEPAPVAVVVGADPDDTISRLVVATELRAAGADVRADLARRKLGKQLETAARDGAHFAVILGDELAGGEVQLRDLPAGTQKLVARADLGRELARAHAAHRHGTATPNATGKTDA